MGDIQLGEEVARTGITLHGTEPVEHLARERDRVAGSIGVARSGRQGAVPHRGSDRPYRLASDPRLVREEHHGDPCAPVTRHGTDPDGQGGGLPGRVVRIAHDLRVRVLDAHGRSDRITVVADHDHDPVDARGAGCGDRVPDQGPSGHGGELLGPRGEPLPTTGREYERHDERRPPGPMLGFRPTEEAHVPDVPRSVAPSPERAAAERRRAAVVTASDGVASGHRQDGSGDAVSEQLAAAGFTVVERVVVPDDRATIADRLRSLVDDGKLALIAITGGTGFGPRDVTPEATRDVVERDAPGLAEAMRASGRARTPMADLSRGVCGVRGTTLLIDLPGSPRGATESLEAVLALLPHALDLLAGDTREHPAGHGEHGQPVG